MPFCHVKAQFEDDSACSVYMGSQVVHRKRTFDSPNYACVRVPCTLAQHQAALRQAQELCRSGLAFSSVQMYASMMWPSSAASASGTFCSKLVVDIMQHAGILPADILSHKVTPSALHRLAVPLARAPVQAAPNQRTCALDFKTR